MNDLRSRLHDYLTVRRALGFKLTTAERLLGQFVAYCEQAGISTVTTEIALRWATLPVSAEAGWLAQRLSMVRGFARWLQTVDPATEVLPPDTLPGRQRRATPYLYTDAQISAIIAATSRLHHPLQRHTYQALIGLLTVIGLRVGEAIRLDREDLCLNAGFVRVLGSKFNKAREVPLHPTMALQRYAEIRDRLCPQPKSASFFLSTTGNRLAYSTVKSTYRKLARLAGLPPGVGRCRPRIHDLRHRLACRILVEWYRQGVDVQARLPWLSTWLGHVNPEATYWYLSSVPELLGFATRRLEDTFEADR